MTHQDNDTSSWYPLSLRVPILMAYVDNIAFCTWFDRLIETGQDQQDRTRLQKSIDHPSCSSYCPRIIAQRLDRLLALFVALRFQFLCPHQRLPTADDFTLPMAIASKKKIPIKHSDCNGAMARQAVKSKPPFAKKRACCIPTWIPPIPPMSLKRNFNNCARRLTHYWKHHHHHREVASSPWIQRNGDFPYGDREIGLQLIETMWQG